MCRWAGRVGHLGATKTQGGWGAAQQSIDQASSDNVVKQARAYLGVGLECIILQEHQHAAVSYSKMRAG